VDRHQENQEVHHEKQYDHVIGCSPLFLMLFPHRFTLGNGSDGEKDASESCRAMHIRHKKLFVVLSLLSLLFFSCAKSVMRFDMLSKTAEKGDYMKAIADIRKSKNKYGNLNQYLYFIDQGVLFHYAQMFDSSLFYFENAEKVLDDLYAHSITNEAASLLTNDLLRPYRSKRYEEVLMHQIMSFDYLGKDKPDEALVESRKIQLIVDRFKQKDGRKNKYEDDGMVQYCSAILYGEQGQKDDAAISLFNAVKAYKKGPEELPAQVENNAFYLFTDLNRTDDLKTLGLSPTLPREKVWGVTANDEPEIILIGYGGRGPNLVEVSFAGTYAVGGLIVGWITRPDGTTEHIVLPAPPLPESEEKNIEEGKKTEAGMTIHIKMAFPYPMLYRSQTAHFNLSVDSSSTGSVVLSNNDNLLAQDVEDNKLVTLARTALRTVVRTIAAQKAKERMETNNAIVNFLVNVGTDVASDQLERADTRVCFLVPKTVQIARIAVTPGKHRVEAVAQDTSGGIVGTKKWETVDVGPHEKKFLFFPSLN
jgi:tetratricopeptide (TPR) repeat protein